MSSVLSVVATLEVSRRTTATHEYDVVVNSSTLFVFQILQFVIVSYIIIIDFLFVLVQESAFKRLKTMDALMSMSSETLRVRMRKFIIEKRGIVEELLQLSEERRKGVEVPVFRTTFHNISRDHRRVISEKCFL